MDGINGLHSLLMVLIDSINGRVCVSLHVCVNEIPTLIFHTYLPRIFINMDAINGWTSLMDGIDGYGINW